MRYLFVLLVLAVGIQARSKLYQLKPTSKRLSNITFNLGSVSSSVKIGNLPTEYAPLTDDDNLASDHLSELSPIVKRMMRVEWSSMPVLEPYTKKNLGPFVTNLPMLGKITYTIDNFVLNGLSVHSLNYLQLRVDYFDKESDLFNNFRADMDFHFPRLVTDVNVTAGLIIGKNPLQFNFHGTLVANDVFISTHFGGTKKVLSRGNSVLDANALHGDGDATKVSVHLLVDDNMLSLLERTAPLQLLATKYIENDLGAIIGSLLLEQVNDILHDVSVEQAAAFLLNE